MRRPFGYTLLELAVTLAVIAILATVAYSTSRAAFWNANLGSTAFEMVARLSSLKASAITEQEDYLFVVVDAPDALACNVLGTGCGKYYVLKAPTPSYTLASPTSNATLVEEGAFPRAVALYTPSASPPPPFTLIPYYSSELTSSGAKRFAIRFARDGSVTGVPAGGATGPWTGYAFALGPVADPSKPLGPAADRKGIVVAFPSGVTRTFSTQ